MRPKDPATAELDRSAVSFGAPGGRPPDRRRTAVGMDGIRRLAAEHWYVRQSHLVIVVLAIASVIGGVTGSNAGVAELGLVVGLCALVLAGGSARLTVGLLVIPAALVYVQTVGTTQSVFDVAREPRILRDAMILAALYVLPFRIGRQRRARVDPLGGLVLAVAAATTVLLVLRVGSSALSQARYLALLPAVSVLTVRFAQQRMAARTALIAVARMILFVAVASAVIGYLQTLGIIAATGYYDGYVINQLPRATGLVAQPNNQAMLLVTGFIASRVALPKAPLIRVVCAAALLGGIALTFSRTGWVCAALLLLLRDTRFHFRGRVTTPRVALGLALIPITIAVTFGVRSSNLSSDPRFNLVSTTLRELGVGGLFVGKPSMRAVSLSTTSGVDLAQTQAPTDNMFVDLLIGGGVLLLAVWIGLLVMAWRAGASGTDRGTTQDVIITLVIFSFTSSAFSLFPGSFYAWLLLFLGCLPAAEPILRTARVRAAVPRRPIREAPRDTPRTPPPRRSTTSPSGKREQRASGRPDRKAKATRAPTP